MRDEKMEQMGRALAQLALALNAEPLGTARCTFLTFNGCL